jgi:TPR repeat protein
VDAEAALGGLYLIPAPPYRTRYVNLPEAVRWLRKAADQGSVGSFNNLGVAYENGLGVKRDYTEAAKWYRAAAIRGNVRAQANLGLLYRFGRGVNLDLVTAYAWLKLSANQGNPLGSANIAEMKVMGQLSPAQLDEAEQKVADFKKQIQTQS